MMKVMFISNLLENSWSILQPLNKGIRPTRPSIMMFCKPHVQMLFEKCDCCGAKLWDLWFLLKNPFSKNNSLSFSPYFSLMFLISFHNNLHRLSQSNNFIGSNDFFVSRTSHMFPPWLFTTPTPHPHSPQRWSNTSMLGYGFVSLAYQGKDIVFRFIIECSSLRDFGP